MALLHVVQDVQSCDEGSVREPLDLHMVKILPGGVQPKNLDGVAPAHMVKALAAPRRNIERTTAEVEDESSPTRPYLGAAVDPSRMGARPSLPALLHRVVRAGLVRARLQRREDVGLFRLRKKDGQQRLIVDVRQATGYHRRLPRANIGSMDAMSGVDCSPHPHDRRGASLFAGSVD